MKTDIQPVYKNLYEFKFPEVFCIVQDTREQSGLFSGRLPSGLIVCSKVLPVGYYSIKGFEDKFCVERKKMSDFFGYIGRERGAKDKTLQKLLAMRDYDFASLVIEASESDIMKGYIHSQVHPNVARGFLNSCRVKYNIHVYMSQYRKHCGRYILDTAIKYYRMKRGV